MRVENQPYGRLNEIIYDQAFTVHPYKHPTIGSMKDLEAASIDDVRDFFQHLLRAGQRDARARRRLRHEGGARAGDAVSSAACRRPTSRCRATSRRSRRRRRNGASRSRRTGRCRRSSSRITSPTTAIRIRIRCTSRRRCCPTARARASTASSSTRSGFALAAFGRRNLIEDPNLFYAVAIVQPGHTPEETIDALIGGARSPAQRADQRRRAAAGEEPVRARLHLQPRVEQGQGDDARARRRDPQRDITTADGGVRHLHEHHGRRRAAGRAEVLHAREPAGADDHAEGERPGAGSDEAAHAGRRCVLAALLAVRGRRRRAGPELAVGAPAAAAAGARRRSSRRTRSARSRTASRSSRSSTTSSPRSACG